MTSHTPTDRVLPDEPIYRPIERFWPYAELSEQPTEEELARLHPELREVLFGAPALPFSISMVFRAFDGPDYERAVAIAKASDEYIETVVDGVTRHRARFFPGPRALDLRNLWEIVHRFPETEVLLDDRPVPYAKELWLPLIWLLIW
jgi:hypothetical protein